MLKSFLSTLLNYFDRRKRLLEFGPILWRNRKFGDILCFSRSEQILFYKIGQKLSKCYVHKVEKILKGSLDSIPSPSVKIQIMGGKVCLKCKGKTLLGVVNKLLKTKSLLTMPLPSNVLPLLSLHLKQLSLPIIWIFTEGDWIK